MVAPASPPKGASAVASDTVLAWLAKGQGFTKSDSAIMVAIALAESSGQCFAVSSAGDYGLWQINYKAHGDLFNTYSPGNLGWADPVNNISMAVQVYLQANKSFHPWTTYITGAYAPFLPRAANAVNIVNTDSGYQKATEDFHTLTTEITNAAGGEVQIGGQNAVNPPPGPGPFLRLLEIFLGVGLLFIGLKQLTAPVTQPITQTVQSVAKKAAVAAAL